MLEKEIKILWGRSGNRCAICKLELTPDGEKETLGEMAHIVAKSADGSRGESSLPLKERDKYSNLILLCPTHHAEIDKNFRDWPATKLIETKARHETWVSEQLNNGNIKVTSIDNTEFLKTRLTAWQELSRDHVAIVLSLTPLNVSGNQIDTMEEEIQKAIEDANLSGRNSIRQVMPMHTRPTEFGLVNEHLPELPKRSGHSFHIFRSGHCEYFQELGSDVDRITDNARSNGHDIKGAKYVIRYTDIAEVVDTGLLWLEKLWRSVLPYEYMDFRCTILNTKNTNLFSSSDDWQIPLFGYPTKAEYLVYEDILSNEHDSSLLILDVLKWVSNCFGLILLSKLDSKGEYTRPKSMR